MKDLKTNRPPPVPPKKWLHRHWKIALIIGFGAFLLLLLNPLVIKKYIVQAYKIPAGSMKPTLLIGDHILVDKSASAQEVKKGDVIVFRFPPDIRKDFVKRVVGMPGDTIMIRNKELIINQKRIKEDYIIHSDDRRLKARDDFGPITVPADAFFVLGDNRDNSHDSRFWGFVDFKEVKGIVTKIYWSWDRNSNRVRWERIGETVQ